MPTIHSFSDLNHFITKWQLTIYDAYSSTLGHKFLAVIQWSEACHQTQYISYECMHSQTIHHELRGGQYEFWM